MCVCKKMDNFLESYIEAKPRWEVVLNNGEKIYQDDDRPGVQPSSAWRRLYKYCAENELHIVEMMIGFRNNIHILPRNMDGYFFSKGSLGCFGSTKTLSLFIVGTLQNNILKVTHWKVPEMLEQETEIRNIESAGECLIKRNSFPSMEQNVPFEEINT